MTTLKDIVLALDTRATTEDETNFHVTFDEFNDGEGDLAFTAKEAGLPTVDLKELARNRYNDLRMSVFTEHGWTEGLGE